ncbi:uncharacterized protein F5891DRAFT_1195723 [Suillus fuscotomentosus]|uniref:Uncharacterized protein n=1 Tax=Suillus fuscotomentosus TaxID=1912939 RepID=A0AAD4DUE3_9AGAM|nr:uncharacterized protein F5891DRAFT_1195723 [Suillus fuscotomentosus]KAG1894032.1 hypothetical protein F5891DRAFT_1195723 [Suillus fuscotomentosus]
MSINDISDMTAITPAGYAELIKTHLPPLSFPPSCDPSGSHQYYFIHGDAPDPNHNSLLSQSSSLRSLLDDQDPAVPADSDNLVVELKCQLMELQHTVVSLRADLLRVTSEKTSLLSTCQALQNIIVNIRSSASSVASSSSASPPSDTSNTTDERKPSCLLDGMIEEECDRELDPADYRSVNSWTKKDWQEHFPMSSSAVPGSSSKKSARGSKRMAQGINVSCTYLQDENGIPVSAQRAKVIRTTMLSCFQQLHTQGFAPESIGQASLDVIKWLVHTLRKEYLELRLCADNWKTTRLMIDNYSQWYNYHIKKKGGKRVKAESEDMGLEEETASKTTPIIKKRRLSDSDENHTAKRPHVDSSSEDILASPPSISTEELVSPPSPSHDGTTPNREPTPPPRMDKGKEKEVVAVEVKNPLSNLVLKPRPTPVSQKPPSPSIVSSSSGSNPAVVPPSTNITPISRPEISSSSDSASLAVKMELVGVTHAEQTKPTINSKPDAIKKRQPSTKPMRVSPKITARNLCALEWQSNGNQKEPASIFATYWNGLSTADKELYKRKVSVQVASSGLVQVDDNHDD